MDKLYSNKTALIIDRGNFMSIAQRLSRDFKSVKYCSLWHDSFPSVDRYFIGYGMPEFDMIEDMWDVIEEFKDDKDSLLIVFPDITDAGLQLHLSEMGYNVWGSRNASELEIHRADFKKYLKKIGLPVAGYEVIKGLENLREHLKEVEDKYVKVSIFRGISETFHHINYEISESNLDNIAHLGGAACKEMEFIVEDPIEAIAEIGYDSYCVDGKFPSKNIYGTEIKDCAYACKVIDYEELPKMVKEVNEKMTSDLEKYQYRNLFSTEMRVDKKSKVGYFIDICPRFGSPPSELMQEMIENLSEIMYEGAKGNLIEPKFTAKYGVQAIIYSEWSDQHWSGINIPKNISQWVKLKHQCRIDGKYYIVPQDIGLCQIGSIVGIGNTIEEATEKVKQYTEKLEGYELEVKVDKLDSAKEELDKALQIAKTL